MTLADGCEGQLICGCQRRHPNGFQALQKVLWLQGRPGANSCCSLKSSRFSDVSGGVQIQGPGTCSWLSACSPGRRNSSLASCYFSFCSLPKSRRKEPDWSLFLGLHPRAPEWSTEASKLAMKSVSHGCINNQR